MNYEVNLDTREYAAPEMHNAIFKTIYSLLPGHSMELINDHAPQALEYYLSTECANQFQWNYIEQGPCVWRIAITRKQ